MSSLHFLIFVLLHINGHCSYFYPVHYPIPATTTSLPEIIINKKFPVTDTGYVYPIPDHPDDLPEVGKPPNIYLPSDTNEINHPSIDYLPPKLPSSSQSTFLSTLRVSSMTCLDSPRNRFFRASIQSSEFVNAPPVLAKTQGCAISQPPQSDVIDISLEGGKVGECGVRVCGDKKMCLSLRLPAVQGLQLLDDRVISLQCEPQRSTVSAVRFFGVKAHPQSVQGRARHLEMVASGGGQRPFEPQIAIYRKNSYGNFNDLLEPGAVVQLGEELLLKATVKESDGWKFSKMTTIVIQQESQSSTTKKKAVTLVNPDGCRNDAMKLICLDQPKYLSSLITIVPFRAFMFQDSDSSDEMLLSVRMFGCLHYEDCQVKRCDEKVEDLARRRAKREMSKSIKFRDSVQDYESYFDFSVAKTEMRNNDHNYYASYNWFLVVGALFVAAVVAVTILNVILYFKTHSTTTSTLLT